MTPFTKDDVLQKFQSISGILPIISHSKVTTEVVDQAVESVVEMYSDFPRGQGFGWRDMTYVAQAVIDEIIQITNIPYETVYDPHLMVRQYKHVTWDVS